MDRILGFEQVSLGLPGASGMTLHELVARGLLNPAPANTHLAIGSTIDAQASALGWLHINCGVTCHNGNPNSEAYGAKMLLRLDQAKLDGSPVDLQTWDPLRTTIGVDAVSGSVAGQPRIKPGDPGSSVLLQLMSQRGALQMPPIATRVPDVVNVAVVSEWIRSLAPPDAGITDAGDDASTPDAASPDAAAPDAGPDDAGPNDDAGTDASTDDAGDGG
jgi:hypothetical protein